MSRLPRLIIFFVFSCNLHQIVAVPPLPSCSDIPRVLCCIDRIATNCPKGCRAYIEEKCPYKLQKLFGEEASTTPTVISSTTSLPSPWEQLAQLEKQEETTTQSPVSPPPRRRRPFVDNEPVFHAHAASAPTIPRQSPHPQPLLSQSKDRKAPHVHNTFEPVAQVFDGEAPQRLAPAQFVDSAILSSARNVIDNEHQAHCGTDHATPPFAPCVEREIADERFLSCCKGQIPSSCHSLCTYEHREKVAARNFINAVQHEGCDLKWISTILHCANKAKDNRQCCETLNLANPELGVGDRCLRMCYIPSDRETIGHVHQQDLVCLSNWNVIMYCARSGLRNYQ
ncbi:unnamed protein product [Bursaphelenchus xylophilus]|uniref:(pine wood nematode) hypothetical protein n=1 Tax=Bursaphelenchus xylophilus TaxID=6326 RepID=A0A1I7SEC5_BURXY|nr:unnamed protein product [Bursaphelenchus xylophilus]CAG9087483.1 unnamed protein product [Bursaphelenchus xylophilus]